MGDEFLDIVWIDCVEDRVEVCTIWPAISGIGVLQILHDLLIQEELGEDVACTKLIELGHVDKLAFAHLQKFLLSVENLAQEVSVARRRRRYIVLYYKIELEKEWG